MSIPNPSVDGYVRKNKTWAPQLTALRDSLLATELTEDVKWRVPCYTTGGANVAFIGCMKESCVLSFVKGALLKDPQKILIQQSEQSQTVRIIRFKTVEEIAAMKATLRAYVDEAIDVERRGLKVAFKTIDEHAVPAELQAKFDRDSEFEAAFRALTPGRQRGYLLHVGGAKQSKTREARVEKITPRVMDGKGMDDD